MKPFFAPWSIPGEKPLVRFDAVCKRFGKTIAVDDLSLNIYEREFIALLGPSGCGKTTLLRMLAGFETPDSGSIMIAGEEVARVPPHRRPVNMMFQSYALFPHMSVRSNVAFGLKQERLPRKEIDARVGEMLALVKLEDFAKRRPHQLSGGQRQRVALARSLAKRPKVLLLDEPMAALDRKLRMETQFELARLQEKLGMTFVIVTHDQDEAMTLAHRIVVMDGGRILQAAPPMEIYEKPNSCRVASFVGESNLIEGAVKAIEGATLVVTGRGGETLRAPALEDIWPGMRIWIAVRPEKVRITPQRPADGDENCIPGQVSDTGYFGEKIVYRIRLGSGEELKATVVSQASRFEAPAGKDDYVWLSWATEAAVPLVH